jgi:hypothetical protein
MARSLHILEKSFYIFSKNLGKAWENDNRNLSWDVPART